MILMKVTMTVHAEPEFTNMSPTYRVNLWVASGPSWALDAYVLAEASDFFEVAEWVRNKGHTGPYEIFTETDELAETDFHTPRSSNLIRLVGTNPNEGDSVRLAAFALRSEAE